MTDHQDADSPARISFDRVDAWCLKLPLTTPYRLAFGPVEHFDTILVRLVTRDGVEGWGEATPLTGYTDETLVDDWHVATGLVARADIDRLCSETAIDSLLPTRPFLATAFGVAREMAAGSRLLDVDCGTRVPVLGLLQAATLPELPDAVERLLAQGFATLKLKVGFDPEADAAFVTAAQRVVAGRAALRLDANQGYAPRQAIDFLERLAPDDIELFEQPCAAGDWDAHMAVVPTARSRGIALMLDESIYALADIERAAALDAARFIKVKLMKLGGLARLTHALDRIRELGLVPVLGNGVAAELNCWQEACVATRRIDNAGEMNGFLKTRERLFVEPLVFDRGAIVMPSRVPRLDLDAVARCASAHCGASFPS